VSESRNGEKTIFFNNGTVIVYAPPPTRDTSRYDNQTGYIYWINRPETGQTTYFFRNGSIGM